MRILLVNNHCITDPTAGVTQSLRTLMEWLSEAGHPCHILTTSRFETAVPFTLEEHLSWKVCTDSRVIHYKTKTGHVPITLIKLHQTDENRPDPVDTAQYAVQFQRLRSDFEPDLVIACNGHPMIREALATAKWFDIPTVFALRGYGYETEHFTHVDHVFTCSLFLSDHYKAKIGLESTAIAPPIAWADVETPPDDRRLVTFVQPTLHKGLMVFLRLADMLHRRRPDIPVLVVESNQTMSGFGLDKVVGIHRMDATPTPAGWLKFTKILLVPSVWAEPFGRVAVEAMINGIPTLVSDRGGLSEAVQRAGIVLPLPDWLLPDTLQLPTEAEIEPWYHALCDVWDDSEFARLMGVHARIMAEQHYSEDVSRAAHLTYLADCVLSRTQVA